MAPKPEREINCLAPEFKFKILKFVLLVADTLDGSVYG